MAPGSGREAKEAFVTGLSGGPWWEAAALGLVLPAAAAARRALGPRSRAAGLDAALEYAAATVPGVLSLMSLGPAPVLVLCAAAALAPRLLGATQGPPPPGRAAKERHPAAVTDFRGGLLLCTAACILAVDFRAFPRRYAKAEAFGVGLMDVGVGAFVFCLGLARPRQRLESPRARLRRGLVKGSPLLALWLGRLVSVKGVGYHEHVGEYGVHWNFFATLAAVHALAGALEGLSRESLGLLGAAVAAAHQAALSRAGLSAYIMTEERDPTSLVSLNKEGLFSLPGYVALYLTARSLGGAVHGLLEPGAAKQSGRAPVALLGMSASLWVLAGVLEKQVERASRRSCNAAYIAFVLAWCTLVLAGYCVAGQWADDGRPVRTLAAINRGGLAMFLTANLLTGAVNLTMDTLGAGAQVAHAVVLAYLLACCGLAEGLDRRGGLKRFMFLGRSP